MAWSREVKILAQKIRERLPEVDSAELLPAIKAGLERIKENRKAYMAKYREENRQRIRDYNREWMRERRAQS